MPAQKSLKEHIPKIQSMLNKTFSSLKRTGFDISIDYNYSSAEEEIYRIGDIDYIPELKTFVEYDFKLTMNYKLQLSKTDIKIQQRHINKAIKLQSKLKPNAK